MINWKAFRNIFSVSIKETFSGKVWKYLIGSVSALGFILLAGKNIFQKTLLYSIIAGFCFLVALVFIRFFARITVNTFKYLNASVRKSVYGEAIILLKESFAKAHLYRKTEGHQDKEFMDAMISFCVNLKQIFDNKRQGICSVSIKVPLKGSVNEATSLYTLCRDPLHHKIRSTDAYKKTKHTIIGNTAFQKALNNVLKDNSKKYYINNNIPKSKDYENSSFECHVDNKLPYKSELVYPIIPNLKDVNNNYDCLGFLCVDCVDTDVFEERYDVAIVEGVVDGIYDLLSERFTFLNKQQDDQNQSAAI
jgi:hypothetical protein